MLSGATTIRQRSDAIALSLGSKLTVSTLMVACVLAIVLGAASILDSMQAMDRDLKVMSKQMAQAGDGLDTLNGIMNSLPPTTQHMDRIIVTVRDTSGQVEKSGAAIRKTNRQTAGLNTMIADIAGTTGRMRGSLQSVAGKTGGLDRTISTLNDKIPPLVKTQAGMIGHVSDMRDGMQGMNNSLALTIRQLNYITAPPHGGPFTVRVDLDKKALPPIPGLAATTDPVVVYPRGVFGPPYRGR